MCDSYSCHSPLLNLCNTLCLQLNARRPLYCSNFKDVKGHLEKLVGDYCFHFKALIAVFDVILICAAVSMLFQYGVHKLCARL